MLRGEYVILRALNEDDGLILSAWQNDREVAELLPFAKALSLKALEDYIDGLRSDRSKYVFIIEIEDQIPVGLCSIKDIDWINGTGNVDIVIYAKNCWRKGYGCDAIKVLTCFGLDDINLYTLYAGIPEDNENAVKCFRKAGYLEEGKLYNRLQVNGSRKNLISLSISKDTKYNA